MARMHINKIKINNAHVFEVLLNNFPDMIHSVDDNGQIVYANKTAETLLGYSQAELLSMNVREIYAASVLEAMDEGFSELKKRGDKIIPESWIIAKDGVEIPVEIRSFSIYDDNNQFDRTFSILRDIRGVKKMQQEIIHAGRLAAIGELASGIVHDINNPLSIISMANEMAIQDLRSMSDVSAESRMLIETQLNSIERASELIKKLVTHLRNFSRSGHNEDEIVDLHEILSDALFMASSKLKKNIVNLENNVDKRPYLFKGSQNNMEQVFVNLITNACDAMAEQTDRNLQISISPCERNQHDFWRCDICDTGEGIPNEMINDIFQSFVTTKKKGEGTGLGLSIARGIVQEHDGDIEVNCNQSSGTTFSVYIPQANILNECS